MHPGIALLGDLHGDPRALVRLDQSLPPDIPIIQVGDFGWYPDRVPTWLAVGTALSRPMYWIRGNHEHYPSMPWLNATHPVVVAPNISFVPDGEILELNGLRIGCLGGAASIDYRFRSLNKDWFLDENITVEQAARTESWQRIDLMVSHVPPQRTISESANPLVRHHFGVSADWRDHNADIVESVWERLSRPPLVCGHMHYSFASPDNVRVLDINESMRWTPPLPSP